MGNHFARTVEVASCGFSPIVDIDDYEYRPSRDKLCPECKIIEQGTNSSFCRDCGSRMVYFRTPRNTPRNTPLLLGQPTGSEDYDSTPSAYAHTPKSHRGEAASRSITRYAQLKGDSMSWAPRHYGKRRSLSSQRSKNNSRRNSKNYSRTPSRTRSVSRDRCRPNMIARPSPSHNRAHNSSNHKSHMSKLNKLLKSDGFFMEGAPSPIEHQVLDNEGGELVPDLVPGAPEWIHFNKEKTIALDESPLPTEYVDTLWGTSISPDDSPDMEAVADYNHAYKRMPRSEGLVVEGERHMPQMNLKKGMVLRGERPDHVGEVSRSSSFGSDSEDSDVVEPGASCPIDASPLIPIDASPLEVVLPLPVSTQVPGASPLSLASPLSPLSVVLDAKQKIPKSISKKRLEITEDFVSIQSLSYISKDMPFADDDPIQKLMNINNKEWKRMCDTPEELVDYTPLIDVIE